jgi:uncharacterized protein (TIGR02757 family)
MLDQNTFQILRELLEEKHDKYNNADFIEADPIRIPHQFSQKEDIEISAFLASLIAWGKRPLIVRSAERLMQRMDNAPFDFVQNANEDELARLDGFVHRTFNEIDAKALILSLREVYKNHNGLEGIFSEKILATDIDVWKGIVHARQILISHTDFPKRSQKHISNPDANAAAKRINMFLRWMVRNDKRGVDFGIWQKIEMRQLICPLDVHTGNIGRKLGILLRKQDDKKAADELTQNLRLFCPEDPVKYDFSLFGLGMYENQ